MAELISGKIAAIESNYGVVINRGSKDGVKKGMTFVIEDPKGRQIVDPDDPNDTLGYLPVEKIKVKVFDVQPRLCRAETFDRVHSETAYEAIARELLADYQQIRNRPSLPTNLTAFANPFGTEREAQAKLQQALSLLQKSAAESGSEQRQAVVEVNVGDIARQVN